VRWIGEDKLVATFFSRPGFKLLDQKTQTWSDWAIEPKPNAVSQWGVSPDHQYLYYVTSGTDPQLMRVHIGESGRVGRQFERFPFRDVHSVQWSRRVDQLCARWLARDTGSQEVYALTVRWP
jgi:hypothetical protein